HSLRSGRERVDAQAHSHHDRTVMARVRLTILLLAVAAVAVSAAPDVAAATARVAAPASARASDPCGSGTPCSLSYAMGACATAGDEVVVQSGDYYASGTTPFTSLPPIFAGVTMHGTLGQARPVIHVQSTSAGGVIVAVEGTNAAIRDMTVD